MRENSLLIDKFTLKCGRAAKDELLNLNIREVSFHSDHSSIKRSPLHRLKGIRDLITNGFKNHNTIKLSFDHKASSAKTFKKVRFPSLIESESRKFIMVLRIIDILIENLEKKYIVTRRDLYYQDVSLFKRQNNVDLIIALICTSLNYKDHEIGAIASQKGLFWGDIAMTLNNGTIQSFESSKNGAMLIPRLHEVDEIRSNHETKYVLIIEKEAVFNSICNYSKINNERILITGKGFPDQLTKTFVSRIMKHNPQLIVYGVGDLDPYGINILRHYKNGGTNKTGLKNELIESCSCPELKPLNYSITHFIENKSTVSDLNYREIGMIITNFKNWKELQESSSSSSSSSTSPNPFSLFVRRELQRMLFFGKKSEIDAINMNTVPESTKLISIVKYIDDMCLRVSNMKASVNN